MDEKLQAAISLYNKGEKAQASKLLNEILQKDSNNSVAWYGLALCLSDTDKKIYCLQRTLKLDPSHQKAQQLLEKLQVRKNLQSPNKLSRALVTHPAPVNKKPLSVNWSAIIAIGVVGIVIAAILILNREEPYQPTAYDAFSHAAGYALEEMYARDPVNYWCAAETDEKQADYWYQIQVSELANGKYYVMGATKAMDQYCVYETGYFAAKVHYDYEGKYWKLDGKIYHSNSCLTITNNDGGECTMWKYNWTPEMSWRPPE